MTKGGITGITLTANGESTTVTPEAFDRYVGSLKSGGAMPTATATRITVRVPDEADFDGGDYMADAGLDAMLADCVSRYTRLSVIEDHGINVSVLWKRKGGKKQGGPVVAKCQKPSGLLAHFCTSDFVIWLGADHVRDLEYTTDQIGRLLYHEARHIGWDDGDPDDPEAVGKAIILGHDIELFLGEVEDTGAWEDFRQALGKDFQQAGLFGG